MWARTGDYESAMGSGSLPSLPPRKTDRIGEYDLELRAPRAAGDILVEWRALMDRAIEPNFFAAPDYLAAATTHLNSLRDLKVLLLWRGKILEGAIPLSSAPIGFASRDVHAPQFELGCSGAPLVDGKRGHAVLAAACSWLAARHSTLVFEGLSEDSPFRALLESFAAQSGRRLACSERIRRHPVRVEGAGTAILPAAALDEDESVSLDRALDSAAIRSAVEEYLILEAQDALASRRPALIQQPGHANLIRTVTRQLGRSGHCQVFTLRFGGRIAASAIVLIEPRRARIWKIVCEPELRAYPIVALLCSRIEKLLTRRSAIGNLVGLDGAAAQAVTCRLALKPGDKTDSIARRLGERMRKSTDNITVAAQRSLRSIKRKPAA